MLYQFSGHMDLGATGRRVEIYANGKRVLSSKAH
jgi:hypothetical protein